jgi:ubiquinone/menaquinone biosynthesis C-methylase UbiE
MPADRPATSTRGLHLPPPGNTTSDDDYSRFGTVDAADDPERFLRFLDGVSALPSFRALKMAMFHRLRLRPGQRVLDVGCGTGEDVLGLAEAVAPDGIAVGVDISAAMVTEARRRADARGIKAEFHVGNAATLDFPDATFDATRIERTLVHLVDPEAAIAEMARVTRPGGVAVAFDVDFEATVLDFPDPTLVRRAVSVVTEAYASGRIGRRLVRLFRASGFDTVEFTPHVLDDIPGDVLQGVFAAIRPETIGEEDALRFHSQLREGHAAGTLFCTFTGFIVTGTRST